MPAFSLTRTIPAMRTVMPLSELYMASVLCGQVVAVGRFAVEVVIGNNFKLSADKVVKIKGLFSRGVKTEVFQNVLVQGIVGIQHQHQVRGGGRGIGPRAGREFFSR